jgi:predicted transcriptional regulator
MALTNEVLNSFFNSKPQKLPATRSGYNKKDLSVNKKLPFSQQKYTKYRPFDDPPETKSNLRQTQDKPETNLGQTQDKVETKSKTNEARKLKTPDKVKTEPRTVSKTNLGQTQDKIEIKVGFSSLVGLQRNITILVYENCKASRDKTTSSLSIEHIALSCKTTKASAQKTIQRLEKKFILKRKEFKNGRSGWTKYELPEYIYQELLFNETQNKLKANLGQSWDKVETEPRTELKTMALSSSGNNILNTTTTGGAKNLQSTDLSSEWLNVDIEPLSMIGFTKTHLLQIASQNILSAELVQGSIYTYAFDLQENGKAKTITNDPISYFMGILRKGNPYAPPSNYESPQDKALRIYKERMQKIEQGRVEAEKEAMRLAFNDWFTKLSDEEKIGFLPKVYPKPKEGEDLNKHKIINSFAWNKFKDEIWPEEKEKIINLAEKTIEKL